MRPAISDDANLDGPPEDAQRDSDTWLVLDELTSTWTEERELPPEVATAIRVTAEHLDRLDPYSLLGIEQDAGWSEVERAYRERLATFHPNRWSGCRLRDLRPSMERVVERLSSAFALLAEEAALEGLPPKEAAASIDERRTQAAALTTVGPGLATERPTFPSWAPLRVPAKVIDKPPRARPPRPPPRKAAFVLPKSGKRISFA